MLEFFNHRSPNLKNYENLQDHLKYEFKHDMANHYGDEKDKANIKTVEESLKSPELFRYWRNSLD